MNKKYALGIALILAVVALAAAQPYGPMMGQGYGPGQAFQTPQAAPQAKSIEGKLAFVDGVPALQAKDKTYLIHFPRFYYTAYTDGIKEGAVMKLDGYELPGYPGQDKPFFQVTKAVVNGKTYDIAAQAYGRAMMGGRGGRPGFGGQGGGRGGMMGGQGGMMGGRW